jgi:hypothetical protein
LPEKRYLAARDERKSIVVEDNLLRKMFGTKDEKVSNLEYFITKKFLI